MPNQHRRRRTGKARDRMMFSKPESPVSPLLYMLCEIHRARDGAPRQLIRPHPHQIQYRNRQPHIPLDEVEVQSIQAWGLWQKQRVVELDEISFGRSGKLLIDDSVQTKVAFKTSASSTVKINA
jgi:hypothetical protein